MGEIESVGQAYEDAQVGVCPLVMRQLIVRLGAARRREGSAAWACASRLYASSQQATHHGERAVGGTPPALAKS